MGNDGTGCRACWVRHDAGSIKPNHIRAILPVLVVKSGVWRVIPAISQGFVRRFGGVLVVFRNIAGNTWDRFGRRHCGYILCFGENLIPQTVSLVANPPADRGFTAGFWQDYMAGCLNFLLRPMNSHGIQNAR